MLVRFASWPWTQKRVDKLNAMALDGYSASAIGAELGITRNAVIGKLHRMGIYRLKGHKPTAAPPKAPKPSRQRKLKTQSYVDWYDEKEKTELPSDRSNVAVSLLQLQEHHCRWPLGDPSSVNFMFCGDIKQQNKPYCLRHCRIAYRRKPVLLSEDEYERRVAIAKAKYKRNGSIAQREHCA